MNTVTASFNTTVIQMTEMSQWPKCLNQKWPKCLNEKKKQYPTVCCGRVTFDL